MALRGIKVVEMLGLAPGPFCGAILADFGASVTVVQKIDASPLDVLSNGKRVISINLKCNEGVEIFKKLCAESDVLLDTFRPGVLEKLGLGPTSLMKENGKLIYARLTGYGQNGEFKYKAGHDINYVAMSGILSMLSKNQQPPRPPLNIIADFAGGSLLCALGIVLALFERMKSGRGQIIDASMTEGAAYLGTWLYKSQNLPIWSGEPGTNALDGGLPCYASYKTKDNKFMAVGALEPQFYSNLLKGLELPEETYSQTDMECKKKFEEIFLTKTQQEWCEIFKNLDACVTPVLDIKSVDSHECNSSRKSFYKDHENLIVPEPAPRLSSTPGVSSGKQKPAEIGLHTSQILQELGYSKSEIKDFIIKNVVYARAQSNL
ncbi:alpha-methylacyl-CoA racemase [Maniola jurtina]|uniref:alpha-methylacyl-CoA racemase n=1 Tax=Maniola jurtina TaxID=191418 RepID=UPI001E68DDB8|nr:alpha-methylacyl-CoA racemase [Maniola jurtina]XP_045785937.1 alpha-methylacyl-CoA racemase [Maniola jurtina]